MKRFFLLLIVLTFVVTLFGCKEQNEFDPSFSSTPIINEEDTSSENVPSNDGLYTPDDLIPGEQAELIFSSTETTATETITRHENQPIHQLPKFKDDRSSFKFPPQKFTKLLEEIGSNGLIVAGYAKGTREGHSPQNYTLTQFEIEKTYFGNPQSNQITLIEGYIAKSENGVNYIFTGGSDLTLLKDNRLVLLFLAPSTYSPGAYCPVFYEIFLPEDYEDYSDTYLKEFLDYFRGDRSTYQYPEPVYEEISPSGESESIYLMRGGEYWPTQDISDEALLEQMKEQILVQTVTQFKIKIWPSQHKQYYQNNLPEETEGMRLISEPQ